MAKKTITTYVDDIDGSDADGTVTFSFDSKLYEIDLSSKNRKKLEDALTPFIKSARSTGNPRRSNSSSARGAGRTDLVSVRAWARDNGHEVSERGRVPASVIEAYDSAH
ncbi:histone-like nucleoid-structuring protein Lsr2 [Microbacterium sp. DT81.1]|uniref:histone-like nucleoid-structuring protein Lsr2 n=1 Tax=Microbacterium sp. DT81.1 TaxID=3393413 RepID=UPI003CF411FF